MAGSRYAGPIMQTCQLGSTGITVTPIGLGLAAVGRPGYINLGRDADLGADRSVEALRERTHAILDAAYAAGVRYVDAARSYGRAEEFLAAWLRRRDLPPGALTVGSKWGYTYTAGWRVGAAVNEVKDHSLATLRRQLDESRALLGPWLRLYQVHSATLESGVLADTAVLHELARQRDAGLAIGVTVSGARQADTIRSALEIRIDGVNPFGVVQATWNLLEPSAGPALEDAHREGCGIIVKEALANGRLAVRQPGAASAAADALDRMAADDGADQRASPDAIAIAAALAQPWADVVLSGAVTLAQLASNLSALDLALSPSRLDQLATLAEPAEAYWAERSAHPWS